MEPVKYNLCHGTTVMKLLLQNYRNVVVQLTLNYCHRAILTWNYCTFIELCTVMELISFNYVLLWNYFHGTAIRELSYNFWYLSNYCH